MEKDENHEAGSSQPSEIEVLIHEYITQNPDDAFAKLMQEILEMPQKRQLDMALQIVYSVCIKTRPIK